MKTRPISQAALDAYQEDMSNHQEGLREGFIGERYGPAELLARMTVGGEDYADWRAESHDTPTLAELLDVAISEAGLEDVAKALGLATS